MMFVSPQERLRKILKTIPAAIPYIGEPYSAYLSSQQIEEAKAALCSLSRKQHEEFLAGLGRLEVAFNKLDEWIREVYPNYDSADKITVVIPCGGKEASFSP